MEQTEKQSVPDVLIKFAGLLGTTLNGHTLNIPEEFGTGYCSGFVFNEHIRMIISDYELTNDLIVENPEKRVQKVLFFKFQNIFPKGSSASAGKSPTQMPSVLIATSRINTGEVFAIHSNTETINIEVDVQYLRGLFSHAENSPVLQSLLHNAPPLLFEQFVHPVIQHIVDEIVTQTVQPSFQLFFLRIKAEGLICRLLMELDKRKESRFYPLNDKDIQTLYKVKETMLAQLNDPPVIEKLALDAGMSPTKLKRVFRQIFGYSIYSYYQHFRMKEAANMLKGNNLSVSEVGYRLGFTNLSHFARVFEEHIGMKPKAYSRS